MKPVIIIGAGASKDYIPDNERTRNSRYIPPITDSIFDIRFEDYYAQYQEILELVAGSARKVPHRESLETYLLGVRERAKDDPRLQKQLISLTFYLQKLFWDISINFQQQPRNNYSGLITQIRDSGGKACIINFNYDTLFEYNLQELSEKVGSLVGGEIKVIKPHGSCDWVYSLDTPFEPESSYKHLMMYPQYTLQTRKPNLISQRIAPGSNYRLDYGQGRTAHFYPAIAVPLAGKDNFVAPDSHMDILRQELRNADKILIIGWKAGDRNMIELLKENVLHLTPTLIVSGTKEGANKTADNLREVTSLDISISPHQGFTNFLRNESSDNFFKD